MTTPTRRTVLAGSVATAALTVTGLAATASGASAAAPAATGLAATLGSDPIAHLLRRATFGATPASLAQARKLGVAGWLDRQFAPARISDTRCEAILARLPLAGATPAAVRAQSRKENYESFKQLGRATIARAAWSERQLFEQAVAFWSNHLHVTAPSSGIWETRSDYDRTVIREHAFGKFADMLKASARHPAMLTYLDQRSSSRAHPNENYARELMELHTVGLDYAEADVLAAARLLTGMTVGKSGGYVYDASLHATGAVDILGFRHANTGRDGEAAACAFLDHLARHPKTAERIARKLCVRFVADEAPASLVAKLAKVYRDSDTAIAPVLRALFLSPEFAASVGQKARTPFEDTVAAVRALGLGPDKSGVKSLDALYNHLVSAGNAPLRWSTPDGYPDVAAAWASPSAFLARCNLHLNLAAGWYPAQLTRPADLLKSLVPVLPGTYGALVDALATRLIGAKLPAGHTAAVLSVAAKMPTSPLTVKDKALAGVAPYLIALVLDSPSFQLR
ncbi:DUF1800 domain-containing protein [Actinoplanes derwentensis]|uniref:Uncharacterized conserved protein, DUF1800 family n=1 Tax=Actinoplanes derwentensis TaxID=113562 RepID=A0A1H1QKL6_9ACTN|nr:DUF1800 domain-containing protein [Actinoplanes derwentensis]GID82112.1 hypothetical protein Ade03nite_10360 [Actinoplanes derwentensis]SDS24018.1 Uncharacterized conserved protein, DUF1800 family [Actinoplanes derwentensis]